ncbi:glucosamine 6-phosphate N-acetyltransferase-like [Aristolochia californica]|uniref:glucosamine 6-phosphate N-acetyltransferase-like n=1 Tax=Aristolochia californica TaxID=171875 RepID=UPI0035E1FA1E
MASTFGELSFSAIVFGEQNVSSIAKTRQWQRSAISLLEQTPFYSLLSVKGAHQTTGNRKQHALCDSISDADFAAKFEDISSHSDNHIVYVIEENHSRKIIATGSLFIVKTLLRNCRNEGHIGDILVDSSVRGEAFGAEDHTVLIRTCQISNDWDEKSMGFYEKYGFKKEGV